MMTKIQRTVSRNVTSASTELQESSTIAVFENIARAERDTNEALTQPQSLLQRWFPTKEQRAIAEGRLREINTESDYRIRLLKIARETQLHAVAEVFNEQLAQIKVSGRQRLADLVLSKQHELHIRFDEEYREFISEMENAYHRAKEITVAFLREHELERLDDVVEKFRNTHDAVLDNFTRVTSEQIQG